MIDGKVESKAPSRPAQPKNKFLNYCVVAADFTVDACRTGESEGIAVQQVKISERSFKDFAPTVSLALQMDIHIDKPSSHYTI